MRAFAWFLGAIILAGLASAAIAYPAHEITSSFAAWPFHRVASRIAMLVLLIELVWLCRRLHLSAKRDFGYGLPWRPFLALSLAWGALGAASAGLGAAFLLTTHLRTPAPQLLPGAAGLARVFFIGLSSGIAVALLEETLMRGAMHTAIERESGPLAAVLLTAPLFAVLHFFAKARIPAAELHWASGFDLLTRSFAPLGHPALIADSFLAWLAVGLILSMTRVLTGNIAVAIGLHAGWVLVLRMLQEATDRGVSPGYAFWVGHFDGLLGFWLLPWSALLAAALWLTRTRWVPPAHSAPPQRASPWASPPAA